MELKPDAARRMPFLLSVQFHPERLAERHAGTSGDFSRGLSRRARGNAKHEGQNSNCGRRGGLAESAHARCSKTTTTSPRPTAARRCKRPFRRTPPDVVLLDVKLPDANGLDLLPQIKKRWPDTEVIVLTGHGTISMAVEADQARRLQFSHQAVRQRKAAGRREMRHRAQGAERGKQHPAPRARNHERHGLADFPQRGHAGRRPHRRTHRAQRRHRAHHRRKRHRQGSHRRPDPRLQPAQQRPDHQDQLRRPAARTDRERTVRLRQRRVHRRAHRPRRPVPPGRGRHAVPGRNFRDADRHAEQAAARVAGPGSPAGRRQDQLQDQLPHHRRHQPQARGRHQGRQAARGFVLSHQRHFRSSAAVARTARGHHAAGQRLPETLRRPGQPRHQRLHARRRSSG